MTDHGIKSRADAIKITPRNSAMMTYAIQGPARSKEGICIPLLHSAAASGGAIFKWSVGRRKLTIGHKGGTVGMPMAGAGKLNRRPVLRSKRFPDQGHACRGPCFSDQECWR